MNEQISPERIKQSRDWVYSIMARVDNGHHFRVSPDASMLVCRNCELEHPNDATFGYGLCPRYWTEDGELIPRTSGEKPEHFMHRFVKPNPGDLGPYCMFCGEHEDHFVHGDKQ